MLLTVAIRPGLCLKIPRFGVYLHMMYALLIRILVSALPLEGGGLFTGNARMPVTYITALFSTKEECEAAKGKINDYEIGIEPNGARYLNAECELQPWPKGYSR